MLIKYAASWIAVGESLCRIHYFDADKDLRLVFLTNRFLLPTLTIALSDHPKPANEGHLKTGQR
jgi:hypothetical protein